MSNQFFKKSGPFNIDELLKMNDIINTSNLKNTKILDIKDLTIANEHNITFFHSKKYESIASKTNASFCITTKNLAHILPKTCLAIIVENVLIATAKITNTFYPDAVNDNFDQNISNIDETSLGKIVKHGKTSENYLLMLVYHLQILLVHEQSCYYCHLKNSYRFHFFYLVF